MKSAILTVKTGILIGFLTFNGIQAMQVSVEQFKTAYDSFINTPNQQTFKNFKDLWDNRSSLSQQDLKIVELLGLVVDNLVERQRARIGQVYLIDQKTRSELIDKYIVPLFKQLKDIEKIVDENEKAIKGEKFFDDYKNLGAFYHMGSSFKDDLIRLLVDDVVPFSIKDPTDLSKAEKIQTKISDYIIFLKDKLYVQTQNVERLLIELENKIKTAKIKLGLQAPEPVLQELEIDKRFIRNKLGIITSAGYDQDTARNLLKLLQSNDNKLNSQDFLNVQDEIMGIIMDAISKLSSKYFAEINNLKTETLNIVTKWTFKAPKTQEFIQKYSIQPGPAPALVPAPAPSFVKEPVTQQKQFILDALSLDWDAFQQSVKNADINATLAIETFGGKVTNRTAIGAVIIRNWGMKKPTDIQKANEIISLLIKNGADVNKPVGTNEEAPIKQAIRYDLIDIFEKLIKGGARFDENDINDFINTFLKNKPEDKNRALGIIREASKLVRVPALAPAAAKSLQDALESLKDSLISLKSKL